MNVHNFMRTCKTLEKRKADKAQSTSLRMALISEIFNPNSAISKPNTSSTNQADEQLKELKAIRKLLENGAAI